MPVAPYTKMDAGKSKILQSKFKELRRLTPCTIRLSTANDEASFVDMRARIQGAEGNAIRVILSQLPSEEKKWVNLSMMTMSTSKRHDMNFGLVTAIDRENRTVTFNIL